MKLIFALLALSLSGCAQWDTLSEGETAGVIVGATVVAGALIIRNGQDNQVYNCISTRSLETGCGGRFD